MGIYIFSWKILREALVTMKDQPECDFGKHIIPYCHNNGNKICSYDFKGYWKDVGTLGSYWEANMELVDIVPEFNLYEEFWKIYTKTDAIPPQYVDEKAKVSRCIIGEGTEIYGDVENSVIGSCVTIGEGAVVKNSIIMNGVTIGAGAYVDKAVIAENVDVGANAKLGVGEEAVNEMKPSVYAFGLVTIGENSVIPEGVTIGKNTAIFGVTVPSDYPEGALKSGGSIVKAGE
jgi:glucose-1-phosphate adenylyltransferase